MKKPHKLSLTNSLIKKSLIKSFLALLFIILIIPGLVLIVSADDLLSGPGERCEDKSDCSSDAPRCLYKTCLAWPGTKCSSTAECAGEATNLMACINGECCGRHGYPCQNNVDDPQRDAPECCPGFHCHIVEGGMNFCEEDHVSYCGDGVVDAGEECDDGNNDDGDGCDSSCMIEGECIPRTIGYWKQPCLGHFNHENESSMMSYLSSIHKLTDFFDDINTFEEMCSVLGSDEELSPMEQRARQQVLTLWLNVAAEFIYLETIVDLGNLPNASTVEEALAEAESLFGTNPETAKTIADTINNAWNTGGVIIECHPTGYCGDGVVNSPQEECDGGSRPCVDALGYAGTQYCSDECVWGDCEPEEWCGDGIINNGEACELPGTQDNTCCSQSTGGGCEGVKYGVRDEYGYCTNICSCLPDEFNYVCADDDLGDGVPVSGGVCGAECDEDNDCVDKCVDNDWYYNGDCDLEGSCSCSYKVDDCDAMNYYDDYEYYCEGDTVKRHRLYHYFVCDAIDGCEEVTEWRDEEVVENCDDYDNDYCDRNVLKHHDGSCESGVCEVRTASEDCYYKDTYCEGTEIWMETGFCNTERVVCDSTQSFVEDCNNGLWCDGQERCDDANEPAVCVDGSAVDCSGNDISGVGECAHSPDDNPYTWDYGDGFVSECVEDGNNQGHCTTGSQELTHTCDVERCGAECDSQHECPNSECSETYYDYCDGTKLVEYDDDKVKDSTTVTDSCENPCTETCECSECETDCSPPETNEYCVLGVCGAVCDEDNDCESHCVGNVFYYNGQCDTASTCSCSYSRRDCGELNYYDDYVYFCEGDSLKKKRLYHFFVCDEAEGCVEAGTEWRDEELVEDCYYDSTYCVGDEVWGEQGFCNPDTLKCDSRSGLIKDCYSYSEFCEGDKRMFEQGFCDYDEQGAFCSNTTGEIEDCSDNNYEDCQDVYYKHYYSESCSEDQDAGTTMCVPDSELIDCRDEYWCNGEEICSGEGGVHCESGVPVDCSEYSYDELGGCDYVPDDYPYTGDFSPGFVSVCDEVNDKCTQQDRSWTHVCADDDLGDGVPVSGGVCGAECDEDEDCAPSECSETYNDYCNGTKLVEYDDDKVMDSTVITDYAENYCSLDSCLCTDNEVDCAPPNTNTYCVLGVCGAVCDSDDDCDDQDEHTLDSCNLDSCGCEHTPIPYCGDGVVDAGEECDVGDLNGVVCTPGYGESCTYCSESCTEETVNGPFCGDGVINSPQEECDDGNNMSGDGCSSLCKLENESFCEDVYDWLDHAELDDWCGGDSKDVTWNANYSDDVYAYQGSCSSILPNYIYLDWYDVNQTGLENATVFFEHKEVLVAVWVEYYDYNEFRWEFLCDLPEQDSDSVDACDLSLLISEDGSKDFRLRLGIRRAAVCHEELDQAYILLTYCYYVESAEESGVDELQGQSGNDSEGDVGEAPVSSSGGSARSSRRSGSGGGGGSYTEDDWECGEWSECVNGEKTQECTHKYSSATKTNKVSCVEETQETSNGSDDEGVVGSGDSSIVSGSGSTTGIVTLSIGEGSGEDDEGSSGTFSEVFSELPGWLAGLFVDEDNPLGEEGGAGMQVDKGSSILGVTGGVLGVSGFLPAISVNWYAVLVMVLVVLCLPLFFYFVSKK